jgi:ASCH domain
MKPNVIKALSVRQPWASLIVAGVKNIENRSWRPHYRGRLYIHAGRRAHKASIRELPARNAHVIAYDAFADDLDNYGLIGSVKLIDCVQNADSPWAIPGLWHWIFENPVAFDTPVVCPGRLGLFDVQVEVKGKNEARS